MSELTQKRLQEIKDFYRIYKDAELRTYEHKKCFMFFLELITAIEAARADLAVANIDIVMLKTDLAEAQAEVENLRELLTEAHDGNLAFVETK